MKLITDEQLKRLRANFKANLGVEDTTDFQPVVKIFTAGAGATWLLSELSEEGIGFGLADLGHGFPELGYIDITPIENLPSEFMVERDRYFTATKTLSEYADEARSAGRIIA
tara:strand:- start:365 stop:700 length:336 start_codon:yes stop_codon:yes gene_type:complete